MRVHHTKRIREIADPYNNEQFDEVTNVTYFGTETICGKN
jgi:hypothetical protein